MSCLANGWFQSILSLVIYALTLSAKSESLAVKGLPDNACLLHRLHMPIFAMKVSDRLPRLVFLLQEYKIEYHLLPDEKINTPIAVSCGVIPAYRYCSVEDLEDATIRCRSGNFKCFIIIM